LTPQQLHRLWMKGKIEAEIRKRHNALTFDRWLDVNYSHGFYWHYPHLQVPRLTILEPIENSIKTNGAAINSIILMPPQHGKTSQTTVCFPAYLLEKYNNIRITVIGHTSKFVSDNFALPTRRILDPKGVLSISRNDFLVHGTGGGYIKYFSFQSGITGTPSDLIIMDDPYSDAEQAESQVQREKIWKEYIWGVTTRTQNSDRIKTSKILIMTPWHYDDISHRLRKQVDADGKPIWRVFRMPALAEMDDILGRKEGEPLCPELQSLESLLQKRRDDPEMFQAMYQLSPVVASGNIVKRDWLQQRCTLADLPKLQYIIVAFDTAWKTKETNDYTAGIAYGIRDKHIYILEVWRRKIESTALEGAILALTNKWSAYAMVQAVIIEETPNSEPIIRSLEKTSPYSIKGITPKGEKAVRLKAVCGIMSNERLSLVSGSDWELDFIDELCIFPKGKHDDQVDALSLGLGYIQQNDISALMYAAYVEN
jgi:predicted phage terminase large subunit-like protein